LSFTLKCSMIFFLSCFFFNCCASVHCGIYKSSYNISYLIHPLHHSPLFLLPSIPRIVSTGLIFPFTYMCTQYLHQLELHSLWYLWYIASWSYFYIIRSKIEISILLLLRWKYVYISFIFIHDFLPYVYI
jgi:hypothetical protein